MMQRINGSFIPSAQRRCSNTSHRNSHMRIGLYFFFMAAQTRMPMNPDPVAKASTSFSDHALFLWTRRANMITWIWTSPLVARLLSGATGRMHSLSKNHLPIVRKRGIIVLQKFQAYDRHSSRDISTIRLHT